MLLQPWIPDASGKLLDALDIEERGMPAFGDWDGGRVQKIDPLFPRVDG
jgi:hypothetical protein